MNFLTKKHQGFALLYSILLTGAILTIGVILMNIITKQLIYSSISRNSELAYYYAANTGRECLTNAIKNEFFITGSPYDFQTSPVLIPCFGGGKTVSLSRSGHTFSTAPGGIDVPDGSGTRLDLSVQVNIDCLNEPPGGSCTGRGPAGIINGNKYFAIASGYSGVAGASRLTKRAAAYLVKGI